MRVKHGLKVDVYQYVENGLGYLNTSPPEDLAVMVRMEQAMSRMSGGTFEPPDIDNTGKHKLLDALEAISQGISLASGDGARSALGIPAPDKKS